MGNRASKDALFDGFAEVGKALANGRRAEIVDVLAQGERHVDEVAAEIEQSVANTSFHLRVLASAGLVTTRRNGTRVYYSLASAQVGALWAALRTVAVAHYGELAHLADAYRGAREGVEEISREELAQRIETGGVVVIDVRPSAEFAAGHITGARSVPFDGLAERVRALPPNVDVVAYCRGPFCVFADEAVRMLHRHDRAAYRLEDGFPEWQSAGFPAAQGAPSDGVPADPAGDQR